MFSFYKKQLLKNEKENNFFWHWYEQQEIEKRGILWQQPYLYEKEQEQLNKIPTDKINTLKSNKEKKYIQKEAEKKQKKENNIFDKQEIFIEQKTKSIFDKIQYQQQYEEYKQEEKQRKEQQQKKSNIEKQGQIEKEKQVKYQIQNKYEI